MGAQKAAYSGVAFQKGVAASVPRRLPDFEADWSLASSGYQNRGPYCRDDPFRKPSYGEMWVHTDPLCEEKRSPKVVEGSSRTSTPMEQYTPIRVWEST
jgi:hypothetical protein